MILDIDRVSHTESFITVKYYIELTDKEKELLSALQRLGFPYTL